MKYKTEFEEFLKEHGISSEKSIDAWGRECYKHAHVQSMYLGYSKALSEIDEKILKMEEVFIAGCKAINKSIEEGTTDIPFSHFYNEYIERENLKWPDAPDAQE